MSDPRPTIPARRRLWPWLAAALTGVLLTLCFAPWNFGWLCWIALVPLLCAVWFSGAAPTRRFALGYVSGLVFFTGTFYWLGSLGTLFQTAWLHGLPLLLASYFAVYFAFWAWFAGRLIGGENATAFLGSRRNLATAFFAACAWVAHEWVRGWMFGGFGWNGIGIALHGDLAMIQIADLTGVAGLSFLVVFCNVMAVIIVRRIVAEFGPIFLKKVRWEFSFTVALVALVFAYGVRALLAKTPAGTAVRLAAVQPNISQAVKFSGEAEDLVMKQLDELTGLAATARPHLLLWPEAATPRGMYADKTNYEFVMDQAARGDFSLLIGTTDSDPDLREDYNIATLLSNRGHDIQTYRKMHLVPFGEYIPGRHFVPLLARIAGDLVPSDFATGREFTVMKIAEPPLKFSPLICFEDSVGDLTRKFVLHGAQMLVNITNDGWFLETAGAEQHVANAMFRAIENRRPLVRCTNTGVTCSVDRVGHVDYWLRPFERGFAVREITVPAETAFTFYTRHGDWLIHAAAAITALHLAAGFIVRRRKFRKR